MDQYNCPTAILLFSHSARAAEISSPFPNRAVSSVLVRRTARTARRTGLPTFFFSEKQQRGSSFGERLAHAFSSVFEKGFENVVAIGHDCPAVLTGDLAGAACFLENNGAVFGPAADGGAWLIGFQKQVFEKKAFGELEWQTGRTLAELVAFVEKQGGLPILLAEKADLDTGAELRRAVPALPVILKKLILRLLKTIPSQPPGVADWPLNRAFLAVVRPLRAPPVCSHSFEKVPI